MGEVIMTNIFISGPGGCVSGEVETIRKALEAIGYKVVINSNCPDLDQPMSDKEFTEYLERVKNLPFERPVMIKVNHEPWGG